MIGLAATLSAVQAVDQAVNYLEKSHQEHDWAMLFLKLERNGWFKPLQSDPRFQSILGRMDFPSTSGDKNP